jgi:hypothetical protein
VHAGEFFFCGVEGNGSRKEAHWRTRFVSKPNDRFREFRRITGLQTIPLLKAFSSLSAPVVIVRDRFSLEACRLGRQKFRAERPMLNDRDRQAER